MDCKNCNRPFLDDYLKDGYCKDCLEEEGEKALAALNFDEHVAEGIRHALNQAIKLLPDEEQALSDFASVPQKVMTDLVVRYSQYQGPASLSRYLKNRYELSLTPAAISRVLRSSPKLLPIVHRLQKQYQESLETIPIYNKAFRVMYLQSLLDETDDVRERLAILQLARVEAEGIRINKQVKKYSVIDIAHHIENQNAGSAGLLSSGSATALPRKMMYPEKDLVEAISDS